MDFGKNTNGECIEGDHMVLGEIRSEGSENTPLSYLPCRDAVRFCSSIIVVYFFMFNLIFPISLKKHKNFLNSKT